MSAFATLHSPALCVFCGSGLGPPSHGEIARTVARSIVEGGCSIVYGGGNRGLMGELADEALRNGGIIVGIIPRFLIAWEVAHHGVTRLEVVESMHERKARMAMLSDAFVMLPGGFGTLEEFFEVLTWRQLDLHRKPLLLVNIDGYFDALLEFLIRAESLGYISASHLELITVITSIEEFKKALDGLWQSGPTNLEKT